LLLPGANSRLPGNKAWRGSGAALADGSGGAAVGGYWQATLNVCGAYMPFGGGEGADKRHVHTREDVLKVCPSVRVL
jgi:hypothetical protein